MDGYSKFTAPSAEQAKAKVRNTRAAEARKITKVIPKELLGSLPAPLQQTMREIVLEDMADGVMAMMERERYFSSPLAALLAGAIVDGKSAKHLDERLDAHWAADSTSPGSTSREVIVGGGLHAAVYCAVRAARGLPKPLVLESGSRVGGAFAMTRSPAFYLNSRNRPGPLSLPGADGALNVIPGAPVQPADLDSSEYQTNTALAWAIRIALAMYARVIPSSEVTAVVPEFGSYDIALETGGGLSADRVIFATGLGRDTQPAAKSDRVMTFTEFMQRMDSPFPLAGMKRVAVVGDGDSGKTVIEALTGQGPSSRWSVASVDWVDQIDWYGCAQTNGRDFSACNRSRYRGIARLLDGSDARLRRVRAIPVRAGLPSPGFECAFVNQKPYDYVVWCTGFGSSSVDVLIDDAGYIDDVFVRSGEREIARRFGNEELYAVGPAAKIELSSVEKAAFVGTAQTATLPENSTALFRYAARTAALAADLS